MNTRDIIAVRKVCELGNLSKAAGQLYLTPQALSLIVKKIENELGVPLFNRVTSGMVMTKHGKLFFERSDRLIQELKELEEMFRLDISNEKGTIRLAVALLSFQEEFNTEWCFIKKKNRELNEIENRFIDYLIKVTGLDGRM